MAISEPIENGQQTQGLAVAGSYAFSYAIFALLCCASFALIWVTGRTKDEDASVPIGS